MTRSRRRPALVPTGDTVTVTGVDRVDVIDGVGLINAYLDLVPRGRFTPYIGLGAGFAVRYVDRTHDSIEEVDGGGDVHAAGPASNKDTKFAPAVSATAGIAWAMSPGTIFDVNYRYTYIGSVDTSMADRRDGRQHRALQDHNRREPSARDPCRPPLEHLVARRAATATQVLA